MKQKLSKKLIAKTLLLSFCFSLFLSFSPLKAEKTYAWDAAFGAGVGEAIAAMRETILGITLAAAKQAAMEMILEEVNKLVDDTAGTGTKIIRDWNDYLISSPERQSKKLMNDYLSNITQGRDSSRYRNLNIKQIMAYSKNYEGFGGMDQYQFALIQKARADGETAPDADSVMGGDYFGDLSQMVADITASSDTPPQVTCSDQERANMFNGTFDPFMKCTEGINYPPTAWSILNAKNEETKTNQKDIARTSQYAGFLGATDKNGQVLTPAGTIENITNKANTLGMDIMAKANSIPEVISAAVINAVTRSIKQGIGAVKERAKREVSNVRQQITNNVNKSAQQNGPRAVFKNDKTY